MCLLKGHLILSQLASALTSIYLKLRYEPPRLSSNQGSGGLASNKSRCGLASNQDRDGQAGYQDQNKRNHQNLFYPNRYAYSRQQNKCRIALRISLGCWICQAWEYLLLFGWALRKSNNEILRVSWMSMCTCIYTYVCVLCMHVYMYVCKKKKKKWETSHMRLLLYKEKSFAFWASRS